MKFLPQVAVHRSNSLSFPVLHQLKNLLQNKTKQPIICQVYIIFNFDDHICLHTRPHSVSFLGKETDTATPLRLENFGRIDFSLGRWITRGKKTPKSMTPYAKVPRELVRIFFHSLLWPQRSLLYGFPPHCTKQSVFLTLQLDRICQNATAVS